MGNNCVRYDYAPCNEEEEEVLSRSCRWTEQWEVVEWEISLAMGQEDK